MKRCLVLVGLVLVVLSSCASGERREVLRADLERVAPRVRAPESKVEALAFDGSLAGYLARAMYGSPAVQARYEEWRGLVEKVGGAEKLPEPMLTYGFFLRRVETRVGAQRQRVGLRVPLPWLSKLTAKGDAAALEAEAAEFRFEAEVLKVRRQVGEVYWRLWVLHRSRGAQEEHLALLMQLVETLRVRLEVGRASLGDVSQFELAVSRQVDLLESLDASIVEAGAELLRAVGGGVRGVGVVAPGDSFQVLRAVSGVEVLREQARLHPGGDALARVGASWGAKARGAEDGGLPDFVLGLDYIDTAEIEGGKAFDNGKDPIMVSVGVSLPLWGGAYEAEARSARHREAAVGYWREDLLERLESEVVRAFSRVEDSARHLLLLRGTLLPQARTAVGAVLGEYETGKGSAAAILLAYRELNALRLDEVRTQGRHAMAWVWLESVVGRPVDVEVVP